MSPSVAAAGVPLPANAAVPAMAIEAWEAMVLLNAECFCRHGHVCCLECLASVHDELRAMCARLLQQPPLNRFPKLQARLREEVELLREERDLREQQETRGETEGGA